MQAIPLGPHLLPGGETTANTYLLQVPTTSCKFAEMDLDWLRDPTKVNLIKLAKTLGCLVVGRRAEQPPDIDAPDMLAEAERYYNGLGGAASFTQMAQAFPDVDIWEGPNEIDIKTPARMQSYATFLAELARLVWTRTGRRAGLGAWSVGTPDLPLWQYWRPVLEATRTWNAVLTRHSYGPISGDEGTWYGLRHRRDEAEFRKLGFGRTPVLITECGADRLGSYPGTFRQVWGWGPDAADGYWGDYLKFFTQELQCDSYVLGAHLFTFGTGFADAWKTFDVSDTSLAGAIQRNPPVPQPEPHPTWATHQVTANALNIRIYPWTGSSTPPVIGQLLGGQYVQSYAQVKLAGMTNGWHLIGPDGNKWASGAYLKPVA